MMRAIDTSGETWTARRANLVYFGCAQMIFWYSALRNFRYRNAGFYYAGDLGEDVTNLWKLSDYIRQFVMFFNSFILSIFSFLGIFTNDFGQENLEAWTYLGALSTIATFFVIIILRLIHYNAAWARYDSTTKSTAIQYYGVLTLWWMLNDMVDDKVYMAAIGMALYWNKDAWYWANFEGMGYEMQQEKIQDFEARYELKTQEWAEKSGPVSDNRKTPEEALEVEEEELEEVDGEEVEPEDLSDDADWVEI